jgi:hypothetical protein
VPTPEEIKQIIDLRKQGLDLEEIGKEMGGKNASTISRWFKSHGIDCNAILQPLQSKGQLQTNRSHEARTIFTREKRLELNDKFLKIVSDRIEEGELSASDLKAFATTYAIMVDKREILEPPVPLTVEDDGFFSDLESKADDVWQDVDAQDFPVQVDATKPQAMADPDLVDKSIADPKP